VLLHLIADYGVGDLAFAEVQQRLGRELPQAQVVPTPVAPFDTLAAGFCIAQLALTEGPDDRIVFHNVAPRHDSSDPRPENEGEQFTVGELPGGILIVGPNAGYSLSFVADEVTRLDYLRAPAAGSQFRSRDFLPAVVAELAGGERRSVGDRVPREHVPAIPDRTIVYADGYGNLKTSIVAAPVAVGKRVLVRIAGVAATAIVTDGTFEVAEGELALAAGSSGWLNRSQDRIQIHELFLRGGSAAARFGHPGVGARIELGPAADEESPRQG